MSEAFIPDERVQKVLKKIFIKYHTVGSQNKLKNLFDEEFKNKKISITPSRLRKIAVDSDFIKLEIHSREGDPKKLMNKCPVCENGLKNVKNQTIWGGKVTLEFRCPHCGYWTGKKKRIPTRYVFYLKKRGK